MLWKAVLFNLHTNHLESMLKGSDRASIAGAVVPRDTSLLPAQQALRSGVGGPQTSRGAAPPSLPLCSGGAFALSVAVLLLRGFLRC